jgi:peptide/nickel transport system ATP-binding protein
MSEPLLRAEGLRTWIDTSGGQVRALDGVDLEIARGETFAIVGESGCGKSMTALTLLRLLPETARIVAGSVHLDATDLLALPEAQMRDIRGRRIAIIFQEPATSLNPVLTVGRQIMEVLERHTGLRGDAARQRAIALLEAVRIADSARRFDEYPFQLSGGMKQRVMIALALAAEPELLIADEPTTALDVTIQAQVLDLLAEVQSQRRMSILLITHDLAIVAGMAHSVAVMYAGEIVEFASRSAFFMSPQHPYSQKLFEALPGTAKRGAELAVIRGQVPSLAADFTGCRFADRCDQVMDRCRVEEPGWSQVGRGHFVRCHLREAERAPPLRRGVDMSIQIKTLVERPPAPLLEVRGLEMHFPIRRGILKRTVGHVKAVDGVSLTIPAGRTLALVGESGCGKTTVGKSILQLIRPTRGEVHFDGVDLTQLRGDALRSRRADFQIIFQDPYASLNPRMRVHDILMEGLVSLEVLHSRSEREQRIAELLAQVGLPVEAGARYPHEFSGGQRQRIAIARALAVNPKLVVCDEPTSALDVSVQAQILNLLGRLQRELGLAYLFITHNLGVVAYLADEVAVMYLGRIVETGTVEEVLATPKHPYTQALLAAVPTIEGQRTSMHVGGELPSPVAPPSGCHFHPRCPHAMVKCRTTYPPPFRLSATREVKCLLYETERRIEPAPVA